MRAVGKAGRTDHADRAGRRLTLALAASLLVHAAFMQVVEGTAARRAGANATPLTAVLAPAALAARELEMPLPVAPARKAADVALAPRADPGAASPLAVPAPRPVDASAPSSAQGNAAYTQVSDPTYYGARSLDVYPQALTTLHLNVPSVTRAPGKVQATVWIDESGTVNEVRAVEASVAELAHAARELLLRTRFTPAAKDGRAVKAQLLVSLDYGAPDPACEGSCK